MTVFLFHFSAIVVLPFWFLMICLPKARLTARVIRSPYIVVPPLLCYVALLLPNLTLDFFVEPSPEKLAGILSAPWAASLFWAYAGAFDLFVGRWIYFDAREREISHRFLIFPLVVSIFFGPVGLGIYFLIRISQKLPLPK